MIDASSNSPIQYISVEAAASINAKGEFLAKGKNIQRLQLGTDSRFYPAADAIQSNDLVGYFKAKISTLLGYTAEFKNGIDTISVNINSVANRLHIQPEDVKQIANQGNLSEHLVKIAEETNAVVDGYEKIKNKFGTASADLMSPIRRNWKANKNSNEVLYNSVKIENKTYHLGFDQYKRFELLFINNAFANGSFGEIRRIENIFNPTKEVLKQVNGDLNSQERKGQARRDIENEYQLLQTLHSKGKVLGIQAPPRQIVKIQTNDAEPVVGYIGIEYDHDYFKCIQEPAPFTNRLIDFHQLITGLKALADRNILHGDLKPENILVKKEYNGTTSVHIADLGGACQATNPSTPINKIAGASRIHSAEFTSFSDLEISINLAEDNNYQELVNLEKQRDVFSMGCILYEALTGKLPFPSYQDGKYKDYLIVNIDSYRPITNTSIPPKMKDLLIDMLQPNYKDRLTADQVYKKFNRILTHYPSVRAQIQNKIKDYPGSTQT